MWYKLAAISSYFDKKKYPQERWQSICTDSDRDTRLLGKIENTVKPCAHCQEGISALSLHYLLKFSNTKDTRRNIPNRNDIAKQRHWKKQ